MEIADNRLHNAHRSVSRVTTGFRNDRKNSQGGNQGMLTSFRELKVGYTELKAVEKSFK
jgi:hypothetical protein